MTLVGVLKILFSRDDDEVDQTLQNFFCKMFIIGRAVCFILAIIFTVVAVITNSQNNFRRVPPPKPFFTRETWVEDFYEGELYYALLKATKYDVIFLMLYAPWDADSQNARSEFETACRYFHKKVYCAAVNCWQANAGCKAFFDNIAMYPLFLVDLHNIPSIRYNGEFVASHMIQFLSSVIKPLERIHSTDKFHALSNACDSLVTAYLPNYKWYKRYYTSSLKYLEIDPRRDVCWSIITDHSLAKSLDIRSFSMKIYSWNETKEFRNSFLSKNVIKWVFENSNYLTRWVFFKNAKNSLISELLEHNPAVILFAPRNMHLDFVPSYLIFKEVALQLMNCKVNLNLHQRRTFIIEQRKRIIEDYEYWESMCKRRFNFKKGSYNSSIFNLVVQNYEEYVFTSTDFLNISNYKDFAGIINSSRKLKIGEQPIISMLNPSSDNKSPQNLVSLHVRERCRRQNMLKKTFSYSHLSEHDSHDAFAESTNACGRTNAHLSKHDSHEVFAESANSFCRTNASYSFFAVDSLLYSHFAAALGINLNDHDDRTTVAVFDNKNEETFVFSGTLTRRNLLKFLNNVANRSVSRWLKSTEDSSLYLNHYNKFKNLNLNEVTVLELHSRSFQPVVFNSSQHVVVYFYSPYCGYCQVSAHTFLSVAYAFRNFSNIVFVRIDGENNDLPWYLVPQSYPSIIIFPSRRKSESVVFPQSLEMNVDNLYEFVLSNVDVEIKLKVMIDKCNRYRTAEYNAAWLMFEKCITKVKTFCLQLINKLIKNYKDTSFHNNVNITSYSQKILNKLKYLKKVYLSLEHL